MKVSLFVTCLSDLLFPKVGKSVVEVLEKLGCEVSFLPDQTCCGQVSFNSGYWNDAKKAAKHFIEVFEKEEYVVIPSGSCSSMILSNYAELLKEEPEWYERAVSVKEKIYEFSEFLVKVVGVEQIKATFPVQATYHQSCHMSRELKIKDEPYQVLSRVEGLQVLPLSHVQDCCGFGGTFSIKMPDISVAMGEEKWSHIQNTGADLVVTSDLGCLMHLKGYSNRQCKTLPMKHIAEVLAEGWEK